MAIVDTDTKSLIINQLTTDQLKELQESSSVEDGQVYVTVDPLYHDLSNMDAMTADRAIITDSNGKIGESATTSTELGYVHGVTSSIQTQLDAKASNDDLALKASLDSPELTGTPTAPTASSGTNTTQIATTAFVQTEISTKAPLESPALTGTPTAPTAEASTNNTQIATTEFVNTAVSNATPGVDNSTVETFDNSSAQGGSTHDLRVKDDGITITKINSSAFTLKTSESKNSAKIPSYAKVEEMVANATPVVDNSTISYNSSTELQAIGTINKNDGSTLYNWRGTLAEYEAAVAAGTIQDNWICVITDDFNPGVTFSGEIVSVTKTFETASNHVEFTEKCRSKNYLTVFQDRVFIYPSEYTLDNDFMGITFTSNIEQGSTVTVNYFKGVPSEKVDELIEAAKDVGIKKYESTSSYSTNELVVNVDNNNPQVYRSLADNNEAALSDTTKWSKDYLGCANSALSNSPYTTNRILEIPQDIKLELNNGTLTLKAGSKAYKTDGTVVTVPSDINYYFTGTTYNKLILVYDSSVNSMGVYIQGDNAISSATAPSTGIADTLWFDTTSNKCKITHDNAATWTEIPLPIGLVSCNTTDGFTSIDQIFNGFGYIGSTVFALPNIKVQGAFGVNEDGTYRLKTFVTDHVLTQSFDSNTNGRYTFGFDVLENGTYTYFGPYANEPKVSETQPSGTNFAWWNPVKGETHYVNTSGIVEDRPHTTHMLGQINISGGKIDSMTRNPTDSVVTSNATNFSSTGRSYLSGLGMPSDRYIDLTLGASGSTYTAPANGWFSFKAHSQSANSEIQIYNTANDLFAHGWDGNVSGEEVSAHLQFKKGQNAIIYTSGSFKSDDWYQFRFVYAEGENS